MGIIKAKKENKIYTITEQQKKRYLGDGYDIYDGDGNLLEHSPKKKISYAEYDKVVKELGALKTGERADDPDVLEILRAYATEHDIELGKVKSIAGAVKKIKEYTPESGD